MTIRSPFAVLLAAALLAACSEPMTGADPAAISAVDPDDPAWVAAAEPCTPRSPALSLTADKREALPPLTGRFDTPDDEWARVAREVPGGWGGLLYVEGRLTLYLVDPGQREAAVSALERLLAGTGHARVVPELRGAAVRRGRWDFAQLYDWYRYLHQTVWQVGGMTSSDIDEGANRITYGVANQDARQRLERHLRSLGIPCYLVAIEIRPPAQIG
ncbi:MAG TPA: hypothetical protein VHG08_01580 [Longimicrobium sp.]|nr:hypothetical protein [Longimicrobium sp.]